MNMDALNQRGEMASTWIARIAGDGGKHHLSFMTFDCKRNRSRLNEVYVYKNFKVTSHQTHPKKWQYVEDSKMRNMFNVACCLEGIPLDAVKAFDDVGEIVSYSLQLEKKKILKAADCVNKPNPF